MLQLIRTEFFTVPLRTRFPFRYGIAALTEAPHLLVRGEVLVNGKLTTGWAAETLPPKWFTKNPHTTFEEDLPDLVRVVRHAFILAESLGTKPRNFFELWQELYATQRTWAAQEGLASLLANLGAALVERVLLQALCRALGQSFHTLARENILGVRLDVCDASLAGVKPCDALPNQPLPHLALRHTVGLSDPLTSAEIIEDERVHDGLPQSLEDCITYYGLRWFKVKLCGKLELDQSRLRSLARLFTQLCPNDYRLTLDGNEQFADIATFREHWTHYQSDEDLRSLLQRVYFVEQPLHRDTALQPAVGESLRLWPDAPALIIDESESALGDCARALALGYRGCSHKNCKGITKSLVNAALLHRHSGGIHSAEDLTNTGPVALLEDLAVVAALGIPHVERNGHHYFHGLKFYSRELQQQMVERHGDIYAWKDGVACLHTTNGELNMESINANPLGLGLDLSQMSRNWSRGTP